MKQGWMKTACAVVLYAGAMQVLHAQVRFETAREFVLEQSCDAYSSLRKQSGAERLTVGQSYSVLAENKQPDASHALLQLSSGQKWIALSCGRYSGAAAAPATAATDTATSNAPRANCLPFFDNSDNPITVKVGGKVDMTPPAPVIDAFGQAVNNTCGPAGKVVSPDEFKQLLRSHPEVLARIQHFTANKVYAERTPHTAPESYLNDLTEAWFKLHAFDHIFCGEPEANGPIGGLHYVGRYLQLQQSGEACRMDNFRQNEVVPGVLYSMGVIMKSANGQLARSSIKGYGLTLSAEDLLKVVTRAFAENPGGGSTKSTACLLPVQDDGQRFMTVFVRRATGIRTFYPDATPDSRDPACRAEVQL